MAKFINENVKKTTKGQIKHLALIIANIQHQDLWNFKKLILMFSLVLAGSSLLFLVMRSSSRNKLETMKNITEASIDNNITVASSNETRYNFVGEDVIHKPVIGQNFGAFIQRLMAQHFIREKFNVTKILNFIKRYSATMQIGGGKINDVDTFGDDKLPECVVRLDGNVSVKLNRTIGRYLNDDLYPMLNMGGYYKPQECRSLDKVAILVPILNREDNLRVFLYNIHPFLMRQKLEYRIFVIEQSAKDEVFNKGRLFNAGFREIEKSGEWECIVFHDVDLLPTDRRIRYSCPTLPRHMCPTPLIKLKPNSTYATVFGGVTAMNIWQYRVVNGYSNVYWAWGGEDNDMFLRLQATGLGVARYKKDIARYTMLWHPKSPRNKQRYDYLNTAIERFHVDGLTNIKYNIINSTLHRLYTKITVDINPTGELIPAIYNYRTITYRTRSTSVNIA